MKKDIENLSEWIENREMRGYYTFTKEDIEKQFPSLGKDYMKTYLSRLVTKAKIISLEKFLCHHAYRVFAERDYPSGLLHGSAYGLS